jgi:hypothetical protein
VSGKPAKKADPAASVPAVREALAAKELIASALQEARARVSQLEADLKVASDAVSDSVKAADSTLPQAEIVSSSRWGDAKRQPVVIVSRTKGQIITRPVGDLSHGRQAWRLRRGHWYEYPKVGSCTGSWKALVIPGEAPEQDDDKEA